MSYYSTYRWCGVPLCKNTSVKTPNKLWLQVPNNKNMRKAWFKVAKRDPELLSAKTRLYFCEDHFDLERDMENYVQYKIMGSVKRIRLKPHCIPSRFDFDRKHKSALNESHLADAKRCKDSVQDHIEMDNVKASSYCIEDSQTVLNAPSMENKCETPVQIIQPQVVPSQKKKAIQACQKVQYKGEQVQTGVKIKDVISSPITLIVSTATSLLKSTFENATKPTTSQSTASRKLCFIEENCDCDTSCAPSLVGSTVDQDYSPFKDQRKKLIANVYHYFEQEYEELQKINGNLDLTPLSRFRKRTALATGVSETMVLRILREEEKWNAVKRRKAPKRGRPCKRPIPTEISSEDNSSEDTDDADEQGNTVQSAENEVEMMVVKVEPPDYHYEPEIFLGPVDVKEEPKDSELTEMQAQTDPISAEVKTEPCDDTADKMQVQSVSISTKVKTEPYDDITDNTNNTLATNKRKTTGKKLASTEETRTDGRKKQRTNVSSTLQHSQGESSIMETSSSVPLDKELDESSLLGETEVLVEKFEVDEEGFS